MNPNSPLTATKFAASDVGATAVARGAVRLLRWILVSMAVALAACGGGSGGPPPLTLGQVSPSSIKLSVSDVPYTAERKVSLSAPYRGTASGLLYVIVEDPDLVLGQPSLAIYSTSATLEMTVSADVATGHYTRPLTVHVCSDAACTLEVAGSPQSIPKDITVTGLQLATSSMTFASSAGVAPAAQSTGVSPPAGLDFVIDQLPYVQVWNDDGSLNTVLGQDKVFTITKNSSGIAVQPLGTWPGHYVLDLPVGAAGHANKTLRIDYKVGPVTTQPLTLLTASANVSATTANEFVSFDIDVRHNMPRDQVSFTSLQFTGTPDPTSTGWLRYYTSEFGVPPDAQLEHMRIHAYTCFYTGGCLGPGTYHAELAINTQAYGVNFSYVVPITLLITP